MAVNIMHQLDESHALKSGLGGSIVSKINMAIVALGGEAHEGTIQDRYKVLKALADEDLDDIRTDLKTLVTTAGGTVADDDSIEDIIDMIASVTLKS